MSRHEQILDRMRDANPVPDLGVINESDLTSLTSLLDERSSVMTDLKDPVRKERLDRTPNGRPRMRPILAFGAALVVVLGVVGIVAFVLPGDGGDVANQPVTPTAAPAPEPTAAPPTEEPSGFPPVQLDGAWDGRPVEFWVDGVASTRIGLVAAAIQQGVWISEDGATWRQSLATPFEPMEGTREAVSSVPQEGSPVTAPDGPPQGRIESYVRVVAEFGGAVHVFGTLATDPYTDQRRLERVVWRSEDGESWRRIDLPAASHMEGGVEGAATDGETLLAFLPHSDEAGTDLFVSGDGLTWSLVESADAGLENVTLQKVMALDDGFLAVGADRSADFDDYPYDGKRMLYTSASGSYWDPVPGSEFPFNAFPDSAAALVDGVLYLGGGYVYDGDQQPTLWRSHDLSTFEQMKLDPELFATSGFVYDLISTDRGLLVVAWSAATEMAAQRIVLLGPVDDPAFGMVDDPDGVLVGGHDPSNGVVFGDQIIFFGQREESSYQWTWTPGS